MAVVFENSLSGKKEELKTIHPGEVRIYNCGPTVYNYNHIGNFRAYMFADILRRHLLARGYKVIQATNITDVDDKIIKNALEKGISLADFTKKFTDAFLEDLRYLKIQEVEHRPKATASIPAMIDMIQALEKQGHTYVRDNSVYFSLKTFPEYGRLNRINPEELKAAADGRFDADEYEKDDVRDFALWKAPQQKNEVSWSSPWGPGRPGWHIECSAMIRNIFGSEGLDIHAGGIDLLFPHHENELAQSSCAFPQDHFARLWLHNEHLLVDGKKMSKSLGNFYTLRDLSQRESVERLIRAGHAPEMLRMLLEKDRLARSLRYLYFSFHYRTKLNFTFDNLRASNAACEKIEHLIQELCDHFQISPELAGQTAKHITEEGFAKNSPALLQQRKFLEAMDDDLNSPRALAVLFETHADFQSRHHKGQLTRADAQEFVLFIRNINSIMDVFELRHPEQLDDEVAIWVQKQIEARHAARQSKDFEEADRIRDACLLHGIQLLDSPSGTTWKKI